MAVRDDRSDEKQTTTGFRGPLMVQSLTSAKSKFLSLKRLLVSILLLSWLGTMSAATIVLVKLGKMDKMLSMITQVATLPKYLLESMIARVKQDGDTIHIEMRPKNYQKLMDNRQKAISSDNPYAIDTFKKYINARIRYNAQEWLPVKLRLKGDSIGQHMQSSKWSMRLVLQEESKIAGMSSFSLQHPKRRSYTRSFLFHKLLALEGNVAINYQLVYVTINGVNKGVYNLEEVPNPMMLKRVSGHEGIVIRFDEKSHTAENVDYPAGYTDAYYGSPISPIQKGHVLTNVLLKKEFQRAADLLNAFRYHDLPASEVFDKKAMGVWLALGDIVGAWHGFTFDNLRLYYNSESARLMPIGWDGFNENYTADIGSLRQERLFRLNDPYMNPDSVFWKELFSDQAILESYLSTLDRVTQPSYLDKQLRLISKEVEQYFGILKSDYPLFSLQEDIKKIRSNQEYIRRVYLYPEIPFQAYIEEQKNEILTIKFLNRKPIPVVILSLYNSDELEDYYPLEGVVTLNPKTPNKQAVIETIQFTVHKHLNEKNLKGLKVRNKVVGTTKERLDRVNSWKAYDPKRALQLNQ